MTFPFEAVYEFFAQRTVAGGLPPGMTPPLLAAVQVADGKVTKTNPMPIAPLLEDNAGKNVLGELIRELMPIIGPDTCLVMLCEAWHKTVTGPDARNRQRGKSLADDPDATECIIITVHRPERVVVGRLPITAGRVVHYLPLERQPDHVCGRLTNDPDEPPPPGDMH